MVLGAPRNRSQYAIILHNYASVTGFAARTGAIAARVVPGTRTWPPRNTLTGTPLPFRWRLPSPSSSKIATPTHSPSPNRTTLRRLFISGIRTTATSARCNGRRPKRTSTYRGCGSRISFSCGRLVPAPNKRSCELQHGGYSQPLSSARNSAGLGCRDSVGFLLLPASDNPSGRSKTYRLSPHKSIRCRSATLAISRRPGIAHRFVVE